MDRQTDRIGTETVQRNGPAVIEAPKARQGVTLGHVRYVLMVSVVLVVVAFAIIYFANA